MRIGWIGFHQEGLAAFRAVVEAGFAVRAAVTLTAEAAARRSGAADYAPLCRQHGIPLHRVDSINSDRSAGLLADLDLDLVIVLGWSEILRPHVLRLARLGMVGAHASLLPHNRGRAPVNWALIRGETQTGNTLLWLAEGVDSGQIIDQTVIPISPYDTCATLYDKVALSNRDMVLRLLARLQAGERPGRPQPATAEPLLPRRKPEDGRINWNAPAHDVYNFVRALTRPYPGAFGQLNGKRWTIWRCALLPGRHRGALPGEVMGAAVSPEATACGQVVACKDGAVLLLEVEGEDRQCLSGVRLCEQPWQGEVWSHG